MTKFLQCATRRLDLQRPQVMGILNVTPDSFSDGGRFDQYDAALAHARSMLEAGAAIIDVGGESTRPGAAPVSLQQELDRVIPVIEAIAAQLDVIVSIDTSKPEVMAAAVAAGAAMINDVYALRQEGALQQAASLAVPVCLMHMQGEPGSMQSDPQYLDVVSEVRDFLRARVEASISAGILHKNLVLDPGFGFGKTLSHNQQLLNNLHQLLSLDLPLLAGLSRKRMIAQMTGAETADQRVYGSVAAAMIASMRGAAILRVHDVRATVDALAVYQAVCFLDEEQK